MNPMRNRSSIIYLLLVVAIIVLVVFNFQQQGNSQESLTINEVALQMGFTDPSAFHRSFKKWTKQTPGQFRASRRVRKS